MLKGAAVGRRGIYLVDPDEPGLFHLNPAKEQREKSDLRVSPGEDFGKTDTLKSIFLGATGAYPCGQVLRLHFMNEWAWSWALRTEERVSSARRSRTRTRLEARVIASGEAGEARDGCGGKRERVCLCVSKAKSGRCTLRSCEGETVRKRTEKTGISIITTALSASLVAARPRSLPLSCTARRDPLFWDPWADPRVTLTPTAGQADPGACSSAVSHAWEVKQEEEEGTGKAQQKKRKKGSSCGCSTCRKEKGARVLEDFMGILPDSKSRTVPCGTCGDSTAE
ncbi:hypothetical protein Z043_110073, partial [Scleropages formosus]